MTIQAFSWALDQPVPGKAKLVLLAMANYADHNNGYCHFDATSIAREASMPIPSLWRYIGALQRNGYVQRDDVKTPSGDRKDYWLIMDRDAEPWAWAAEDGDRQELERPPSVQKGPRTYKRPAPVEAAAPVQAIPEGHIFIAEGTKEWHDHCAALRAARRVVPFASTHMISPGVTVRGAYVRPLLAAENQETFT